MISARSKLIVVAGLALALTSVLGSFFDLDAASAENGPSIKTKKKGSPKKTPSPKPSQPPPETWEVAKYFGPGEGTGRLTHKRTPETSIADLQWLDAEAPQILVKKSNLNALRLYLRFNCRYVRPQWKIIANSQILNPKDGSFEVDMPLSADGTAKYKLGTIGPFGQNQEEAASAQVDLGFLKEIDLSNTSPFLEMDQPQREQRFVFKIGLGPNFNYFSETDVISSFTELSWNLETHGAFFIIPKKLDLRAELSTTVPPLVSSPTYISSYRIKGALGVGYWFSFLGEKIRPSIALGFNYQAMFVTRNAFGWPYLVWPNLNPGVSIKISSRDWINAQLKIASLGSTFGFSFDKMELAISAEWERTMKLLGKERTLGLRWDFSNLSVVRFNKTTNRDRVLRSLETGVLFRFGF